MQLKVSHPNVDCTTRAHADLCALAISGNFVRIRRDNIKAVANIEEGGDDKQLRISTDYSK